MLNQGSCGERLGKAKRVLDVIQSRPWVAALLGMDASSPDALERGWALYHEALAAYNRRSVKKSMMLGAIDRCTAQFQAVRTAQTRLTALARVMITTPADRDRLGLSGRRAEGLGAWRCQAEIFHANLTDVDRELLRRVGVTATELAAAKVMLDQLAGEHAACIAAKAEAKAATARKAEAMAAMASYLSVLIGIVRALEPEHPQLVRVLCMKPDGRRRAVKAMEHEARPIAPVINPEDHDAESQRTKRGRVGQRSKQGRGSARKRNRRR